MTPPKPLAEPDALASQAIAALDGRRQIAPFSASEPGLDLPTAYAAASRVRAIRVARGEKPVGRKIGFTNRNIWAEYGVYAPIWGDVYDDTARDIPARGATVRLDAFVEPRIEPEVVLGLARAPAAGMDDAALLGCIGWVAHGFEIVQSIFPGWVFTAADTIVAFGLHGALLVGPRHPVGEDAARWLTALTRFEIDLSLDDQVVDRGHATNVLGGPLPALRHLVDVLEADPRQPPLRAGEMVTTGTLTRAFPIAPGQTWSTALRGIDCDGLQVRFD